MTISIDKIIKEITVLMLKSMTLPVLLFISVAVFNLMGNQLPMAGNIKIWGIILFVSAVACGVALPVLFRTGFYRQFVDDRTIAASDYIRNEKKMIRLCSLSLVFATAAYLLIVSPLYLYGSVLAALYGIYGVLPFKLKIYKDVKMYKIQADN